MFVMILLRSDDGSCASSESLDLPHSLTPMRMFVEQAWSIKLKSSKPPFISCPTIGCPLIKHLQLHPAWLPRSVDPGLRVTARHSGRTALLSAVHAFNAACLRWGRGEHSVHPFCCIVGSAPLSMRRQTVNRANRPPVKLQHVIFATVVYIFQVEVNRR